MRYTTVLHAALPMALRRTGRTSPVRAEGEYHAMSSFDHPNALTEHASGFGFGFGVGFAWGGR